MNWNVKKFEEKNTPKFLSFEVIKRVIDNKEDKETKKENEFSYQARMFIKDFEGFGKTKDKPKNHQEEPQEKQKRENTAYAYYDSEGIPTIGYGFNLTDFSVFEILKDYLHPKPNNWLETLEQIKDLKFEKKEIKKGEEKKNVYVLNKFFNDEEWKKITQKIHKNHQKKDNQESLCFDRAELGKNIETFDSALQSLFPYTLSRDASEKIIATLLFEKIKTITNANTSTRERVIKTFLGSSEGVALLSLYYNRPSLIGEGLKGAYEEKNRFKMWFEIRYNSNKGKDIGIAKRRFAESNVFGLFENTKRGEGYKNTTNWEKSEVDLKETMIFFTSLHSKFEKEEKKSYFEYIKHYESEKKFNGESFEDIEKPKDFTHHYKPYKEVFSPFVKTFNDEMKKAGCQYNFELEDIFVVNQYNILRIAKEIETESQDGEVAVILEKGTGIGFLRQGIAKIQNNKTWHIILTYDNHIDCLGFEYPQKLAFYALEENQIIKLRGCDNPLIHQSFSFKDRTVSGLSQYDINRRHIHCFKSLFGNRCSPNLLISNKCLEPIATIYNLRSEGDNNA